MAEQACTTLWGALAVPEALIALCFCEHGLPLVLVCEGVVAAADYEVRIGEPVASTAQVSQQTAQD